MAIKKRDRFKGLNTVEKRIMKRKNDLRDHYSDQLVRNFGSNASQEKKLAELKEAILKVTTLEELRELLEEYSEKYKNERNILLNSYSLGRRLNTWKEDVDQLAENFKAARSHLTTIKEDDVSPNIAYLLDIFLKLLQHPQFLFHTEARSLLQKLQNPDIQKNLAYMFSLPAAENRSPARRGSFIDLKPTTTDQAYCLNLLDNIVKHYTSNIQRDKIEFLNGLFQNYLLIQSEISQLTQPPSQTKPVTFSSCTLL